MERGDADIPANTVELAVGRAVKGEYHFEHINRPTRIGRNGDIVVQLAAGGGGYGDVLRRDPARVIADVKAGLVSNWTAENIYCVRYDPATFVVDIEATERARTDERKRRLQRGKRWDDFMKEWSMLKPSPQALAHFGSWPDGVRETPLMRM